MKNHMWRVEWHELFYFEVEHNIDLKLDIVVTVEKCATNSRSADDERRASAKGLAVMSQI